MFSDLFNKMNEEIKKNPRARASYKDAPLMTDDERKISFLNRYFIYKKVRKVSNADKIATNLQHKTTEEIQDEIRGTTTAKEAVTKALAETAQAIQESATKKTQVIKPNKKTLKLKVLPPIAEGSTLAEGPANLAEGSTLAEGPATLMEEAPATLMEEAPATLVEPPAIVVKKPVTKAKRILKITIKE
jgi:hypothetical protein